MVMAKNKKNLKAYTHGSVAYDYNIHPKKKRKKLESKKPNINKSKALKIRKVVFTLAAIFILSFLTISRFVIIMNMSHDIREVKKDIKKVQQENENIKVDLAIQDNIKDIDTIATEKYGMVIPDYSSRVYIDIKPLTRVDEKPRSTATETMQKILGLIY